MSKTGRTNQGKATNTETNNERKERRGPGREEEEEEGGKKGREYKYG